LHEVKTGPAAVIAVAAPGLLPERKVHIEPAALVTDDQEGALAAKDRIDTDQLRAVAPIAMLVRIPQDALQGNEEVRENIGPWNCSKALQEGALERREYLCGRKTADGEKITGD
jgi:hypothetical protein